MTTKQRNTIYRKALERLEYVEITMEDASTWRLLRGTPFGRLRELSLFMCPKNNHWGDSQDYSTRRIILLFCIEMTN